MLPTSWKPSLLEAGGSVSKLLHPAIILIGVFGGTYALGVTGLFLGPVVLAVFATTIAVFSSEYDALSAEAREDRA